MTERDVLICGAGVAGLALAHWLRVHGDRPTVVERSPELRTGGYKVDIRGAALDVVGRMGLLDELRQRRTEIGTGTVVTADGRRVAAMDGDTFGGRVHGDVEVRRGDLLELLHREAGVEVLFDETVTDLRQDADGVDVSFGRAPRRRFDLVVGADGLRSAIREEVFGPHRDHVRDLGYQVCVYSVDGDLGLDREEVTYVAAGRTTLAYRTAGAPSATAMFLFTGTEQPPRERADQQRVLERAYAGQGWRVPELLAAAGAARDFYFDSLSQVKMDAWADRRVVLVGDAAYGASPASGQGTSMALVGGYVLAGELARQPDHAAGFADYQALMRPYVERNQALGPANFSRMVLPTERRVRGTLTALSVINRLPFRNALMARAVAPIHRAATAITLPTY